MKKIQGTLIAFLLTIAILTSMPLTPAQETKEQGRRVITAINGQKLEKPIPLSKFFKQVQEEKSKKGEGVNGAEVKVGRSGGRVKKPRGRKKDEQPVKPLTLTLSQEAQPAPSINITEPSNGTAFPYDEETGCHVSIRFVANSTVKVRSFTIVWNDGEPGPDNTTHISNPTPNKSNKGYWYNYSACFTYEYPRSNHTIHVVAIDEHNRTADDAVFIYDGQYIHLAWKNPNGGDYVSGTCSVEFDAWWVGFYGGKNALDEITLWEDDVPDLPTQGEDILHEWYDTQGDPVSYSWNTEGEYGETELHVEAYKAEEWNHGAETKHISMTVYVDNADPDLTWEEPDDLDYRDDSYVKFDWSVTDTYFDRVEIEIQDDDGYWHYYTSYSETGYKWIELENYIYGSYGRIKFNAIAYDKAGHTDGIYWYYVYIDQADPWVSITQPSTDETFNKNDGNDVTLKWNGGDMGYGVKNYKVKHDGGSWSGVGTSTGHTFNDLGEGWHTLEVKAVDHAGRTATDSVDVFVDTTRPEVSITSIDPGDPSTSEDITVYWSASDPDPHLGSGDGIQKVKVKIVYPDGSSPGWQRDDTSPHTFYTVPDGISTIYVRCWDKVGNAKTTHTTVEVDTTLPTIESWSISNANQGKFVQSRAEVEVHLHDYGTHVRYVKVYITGTGIKREDSGLNARNYDNTFTFTNLGAKLGDGEYTLALYVEDGAGNPNSDTKTLVVDTSKPKLSYFKIAGDNISKHSYPIYKQGSTVSFDWGFSDKYFKDYKVEVVHLTGSDDHTYSGTSSSGSESPSLSEGKYNIIIKAWDKSGNKYELNLKQDYVHGDVLILDRTKPVINSFYPSDGEYFNNPTVEFSWDISDDHFERVEVHFYNKGKETFYNAVDGKPVNLAKYYSGDVFTAEFWIKAVDKAGNSNSTGHREITVDTVKPTITINSPENESYNASVHILVEWSITDDYYKNVSVKIVNAGNNDLLNSSSFEDGYQNGAWTATVNEGEYEIEVIIEAFDEAGNENEASIFAYIDTVSPSLYDLACNGTKKNGIWYLNMRNTALSWEGGDTYFSKWIIETPSENITITNESVKSKVISLSNGEQTVSLYAFDLAGNYNEKSIDIAVDTNPPEFYFAYLYTESHKDNDTYWSVPAGDVPFSFTFYDNYDYSLDYYVTVSLDSTIVYSSSTPLSNGSENSINLDVAGISQGVYDLTMKIQDVAGNVGEKTFEEKVIVDTKKPTVSFITGNETVFGSTSISVTVEVKDISHFNFTQYNLSYLDGNAISPTGFNPKNRSSGTFTLNYEVSSNGTYFLFLQIVDLVGNSTTTKQLYLYVDLDPPKIEEISIGNGTIYGTGIIPAYVEVSDDIGLKNVSLILNGTEEKAKKFKEIGKSYAMVDVTLTELSSSRHKLTVVAFDHLDRNSSDYVIFFVDKEKPSIENYTEDIFSSDPVVNFNVSDDLSLKNVSLIISNDTYRFEDNETFGFREEGRYEYNRTVELGSGHYLVKIRAYDFSNKTAYLSSRLTIDKNSPSVTIQSVFPSWNESGLITNSKEVNISWVASDNTTSLSFKVFLNGDLINETGEYVYELSLPEGTHTIGILAVDGAGNSKLDAVELRVVYDYMPPAVTFITANGTVFSDDDVMIRLNIQENTSFSVRAYVSGEVVVNKTYEPGNVSIPFFNFTSGTYRLTLMVRDVFSHLTKETFIFSIDLAEPTVKIYMDNGTWFNTENVSVTTFLKDDVGLRKVRFLLNGSLLEEREIEGKSACETVNLTKLSSSVYRLEVKAFDVLNRTSSDYDNFNIDTLDPKPTILKPLNGAKLNNSSVLVKYKIEEGNLKGASLYLDGREYKLNKTSGNVMFKLGEGGHSLLLLATDKSGNLGEDEVTFTVRTGEEIIDVSYEDTFIDDSLLLNTSEAELTFNTSCVGNYTVRAFLDNQSVPIRNGTINFNGVEDGIHVLRIVVSVSKEVISETKRTIVIDTEPPRFEEVRLLSNEIFVGDNLSIVWKISDLSGVAQYRVFVNGELYSITQEPCASIVISEENNTIKIAAMDFNSFSSSKTIFVKAKEDRKKTNPPEKPDTESPYEDGKREEPPYLQEKEEAYKIPIFNFMFSTLSLTLITAAIFCYFLRKKKYMALFLGVFFAFSFTVPNIDVERRVEKGKGNGKQGKLAHELKRKGYVQLYKSDGPAFRMSNLYGAISEFTLPAQDFPNNTQLLNQKYVPLKYHVQALFNKPWDKEKRTGGKKALITFIPGYNVTDREAGRKLLDSIATFTETVADYHLGLYGRFATASNLLYAIKLLNDHNLHVSVLILTHGGKDVGMYTRDAGGMIANARHLEYLEEQSDYFNWDLKVSKVIGLYCHAKDNMESNKSVLKYFKGKGARVLGIEGSPNSMDFFQQVQDILTGGVWRIKDVEVKYPVMVDDVEAEWVMKEETSIVDAEASYENKSVSYFVIKKKVSSYIVYENGTTREPNYGTSTEGDIYEKYTDEGGKVTESWKTERVNGYPIRHEFREKVRSEYVGSVIQKGDDEAEFARMLGDFLTEKPSILAEITKLKGRGLNSLKEVREAISELEDYQQLIFDIVQAARNAYAMRFGNPTRKAILYEYRRHLSEIMRMRVKVRMALMSKRWLRMAVNLLDKMDELRELKDDILAAYERVKEGNYSMETVSRLPTDLKLVRKGIQLSFSLLIIKMKIQITGSFAGSIAGILKRKYRDLKDFNKLRGAFITLMRGKFLVKLIPKVDLIQKLLSPLSDRWSEVTTTVERIKSGNYSLTNNTLEEIQEDENQLLWALDRLKTLRVLSFQLLLFRSFYPKLAGKIYDRTHQYTSKFFDFLTAKMSLRGLKQIAEVGENALEVKGKVDEQIETIESIKGGIRANHDNVTNLLTLKEQLKGNLTILRRRLWKLEGLSRKAGGYKYRTYGKILAEQIRGLYNESRWDTVNVYEKDVAGVKLLITLYIKQQEFMSLNATATEVIANLTELVENNETNVSKVMKRAGRCLRIVRKLKGINLEIAGLTDVQTGFEDIVEEKAGNLTGKITDSVDAITDAYKRLRLVVRSNFLIARFEQVNGTIEELMGEILAELNKGIQKVNTSLIQSLAYKFLDARDETVEILNKMCEVKREAEAGGYTDIEEEMGGYIEKVNAMLDEVETDATNLKLFSGFIEKARKSNEIWEKAKDILEAIKDRLNAVITGVEETGKVAREDITFTSEKASTYLAITTHMLFLNVKLKDNYENIDPSTTLGSAMKEKAEKIKEPILSRNVGGNRDLMVVITYIMNSAGKLLLLHIQEEKEIGETVSSFKALDEDETRGGLKRLKETLRRMRQLYTKCHGSLNFLEAKEGIEEELKDKLKEVVNLALATRDRYRLGKLILAQNLPQTIRTIKKGYSYWDETVEDEVGFVESLTREEEKRKTAEDEYGGEESGEDEDIPEGTRRSEDELKSLISDLKEIGIDLSSRKSNIGKVIARLSSTSSAMSYDQEALKEIKGKIREETKELTQTKQEIMLWNEKADRQRERLKKVLESLKNSKKPDSGDSGEKAGETVEQFTVVDELIAKLKRGYHEAKARVFQKVDDIFDKAWSKWMRKPVKAALRGSLFLGSDFIIRYIIDSGWFRSFLSVAYNMLQAGKSMAEIIGYGIAWAFMKLLQGIFWLIEKIMAVYEFIVRALGLSTTWFDKIMDKYIDPMISWVNDKVLYFKEKVMFTVDRLVNAVGTMVNSLFAPVLMGVRALMSEFGNLLYNFSKMALGTLISLRDLNFSEKLGDVKQTVMDKLADVIIPVVASIGAHGIKMMPSREQVKKRMDLLLYDFAYAMVSSGSVSDSDGDNADGEETEGEENTEMEMAREFANDMVKLETMHLIAEQVQENTFIQPLSLYWQVQGRILDQGSTKNVYFSGERYSWDDNIATMLERLYDFEDEKPKAKAHEDATRYFLSLANEVELTEGLKGKVENEFILLKVLHKIEKGKKVTWEDEKSYLEEYLGEGAEFEGETIKEQVLSKLKELDSLNVVKDWGKVDNNDPSSLTELELNNLDAYARAFSNFKTKSKSHYEQILEKGKWKEMGYRLVLRAMMIWKFVGQFGEMKDALETMKKEADISGELEDYLGSQEEQEGLLGVSLKEPKEGDDLGTIEDKLEENLGKAFTLMFACQTLRFRKVLKEMEGEEKLWTKVKDLEKYFYGEIKGGIELMEELGKGDETLAEKMEEILSVEKLNSEIICEELTEEITDKEKGVFAALTNMERYSSENLGTRWGMRELCLSYEEMSKLTNVAELEIGILGETHKPGRKKEHKSLSKLMLIGWKGGPYTVTSTGTLYLPLNIFASTEVNEKEVTMRIPAELVLDSNHFSHSFERGNENLSLRDAMVKALRLITKDGWKIPLIEDLRDSIKHEGEGTLDLNHFTSLLSTTRNDFLRTLSRNFSRGDEEKVRELIELGVITDEEGDKIENASDVAKDIAHRLPTVKENAGALSLVYTYVKFYESVAEAVEGEKVELDDISELEEYQDEAKEAWQGTDDKEGVKERAENILDKYKEMIRSLRERRVEERAESMGSEVREELNEKFYGGLEGSMDKIKEKFVAIVKGIKEELGDRYDETSLGKIKKIIRETDPEGIKEVINELKSNTDWLEELAEGKKNLLEMVEAVKQDKSEKKEAKGILNAFKITDLLQSFYSKSTTAIREELKALKKNIGEKEKEKVSNILEGLLMEFNDELTKAREEVADQRHIIYEKAFPSLPSSLEALSLLYRTSIEVNGEHYTSIPASSYLGEMVLAWNQVLNVIGRRTATSARNTRSHLKTQLSGIIRVFFNSNSFLTETLARGILLDLDGLWSKLKGKGDLEDIKNELSGVGEGIYNAMSEPCAVGRNYRASNYDLLKRMKYFVGYWFGREESDRAEVGESLLNDLEKKKGEKLDREIDKAVVRFKERMMKGGQKWAISGAMIQLFGEVMAESYARVNSQVIISAASVAHADNMGGLSLAIARLAYSQDAYKVKSRLGILLADAIREIRNTNKERKFDKVLMKYSYDNLINELKNLANRQQYECENILDRIEDIGISKDKKKKYFKAFQDLYTTVEKGLIKDKGLLPHFRKKSAKAILEDIKSGEVFDGLDVEGVNKDEIKERLGTVIENDYLLVKDGRFRANGIKARVQLLGMSLRMRALGMIAEEFAGEIGVSVEEFIGGAFTWFSPRMHYLLEHVSEEKKEEIAEGLSLEEAESLTFRLTAEKTLSLLFSDKESSEREGKSSGKLKALREIIKLKVGYEAESQNYEKSKNLDELSDKLSKEYCKKMTEKIGDTAISLEKAIKRKDNGKIVKDDEGKPKLTEEAKDRLKEGLKLEGFSEEEAEKMSEHLEEAVKEKMAEVMSARWQQKVKKVSTKSFIMATAFGMVQLIQMIINFIMQNTRCQKLLQLSFVAKATNKLKGGLTGRYISNLVQNFYTGFIVGLMSFVGMVVGSLVVRLTTDGKELKKALNGGKDLGDALKENSPVIGFMWFKLSTIAWLVISAFVFPVILVLISQKYLGQISLGKGGAAIFTGITGIWAYADMNGKDMFGSIPFFVSLSGMLWIWDEFDDFQDAKERLAGVRGEGGGGLMAYVEIFLLPLILGFFGTLFGMTDPMVLVIPGRLGFMKYTTGALPKPWNWILHALYRVVATMIGGIVASGGIGGFAIYMIGSILANFAMKGIVNAMF